MAARPLLHRYAKQVECLTIPYSQAHRPTVAYLIRELEDPARAAIARTEAVPPHMFSEEPVTFRMCARDSPSACTKCGSNTGCHTLIAALDELGAATVHCDECKTVLGELWLDVRPGGRLEIGEANSDVVCRSHDVMLNSFRALQAMYC